ncbi:MAG: FAD-dependent oxidoreductase [Lachnospiraceae bacterium]|nr:FAD-dependent oxidoreductase [Lachnospiraceae bacterium]MCI9282390.1 FAD-dependent oxidoreductase [Lachnospiraceae bacterium]
MKVVIVGGVAGGAGTAARLRRNDEKAEIILLEKGPHISYANCGLPYYVGGVIQEKGKLQLQTPQSFYNRFRVDVRTGHEVVSVNLEKKTVVVCAGDNNYEESYDKLVLSPGAEPVVPPIEGIKENRDHIFTLRNVEDSYHIYDYIEEKHPKTCAVIGAGFIGMEIAENLFERGISVSIIEGAEHVMPPLDSDMAHRVHNEIRSRGIALHLNQMCSAIGKNDVTLSNGLRVKADFVILSIGVRPATEFLRDSGIALGKRGEIVINEYMETSHKDIYALGDAVAVPHVVSGQQVLIPLASPANKQGRIVGDNLCGKHCAYKGSQGTSIMKFFDLVVAVTGEKEESLKIQERPYGKVFTVSASHAGYYPGGNQMFVKTLFDPESGRILGAQIVGKDGVDKRIDLLANAVRFRQTCYELQEEELAYAPPFSSAKDPVNMVGYVIENVLERKMKPYYMEDIENIPKDAVCLDVRTRAEYEMGHIPGYKNIPLDELRERMEEIDKTKEIYITCQIGLRGYLAQCILEQYGRKTKNLSGGYALYQEMSEDRAKKIEK